MRIARFAALAFLSWSAQAATFTVVNTNDSGAGSLRAAVAAANATPGPDLIDFAVAGTIVLTSGQIDVTESVTIDGPGAAVLAVSGNDSSTILHVDDGNDGVSQTVLLDGLTLAHGSAIAQGGAVMSRENLTVTGCTVTENSSVTATAGIENRIGFLTIRDSLVEGNHGAGIGAFSGPAATVLNVRVTGNAVGHVDTGLNFAELGSLLIEDSTISGNLAGGVSIASVAQATVRRTTISGNARIAAGGANLQGSTVVFENATISGNQAGHGGGLGIQSGTVIVRNSTIAGNRAVIEGGNILLEGDSSSLSLVNSIVAGGEAQAGEPDIAKVSTLSTINASYSLIETPGSLAFNATNITGQDPQLGPLQNNGGTTETRLPALTSPVINAGDPAFTPPPATDQRGLPRVAAGRIDMGAVELQQQGPVPSAAGAPTLSPWTLILLAFAVAAAGLLALRP